MPQEPKAKVVVQADNSDFNKGAREVKQGLRDLEKTGASALGSLGDAFGVNTSKIGQMTSALRGVGAKMSECGNAGVKAFGNILKAIGPVDMALAGLGIGVAVAGFRQLQKEADAFKQTVEGANMELATAAYVDTYRQILRDMSGNTGKAMAEAESSWRKFFGEFKSIISDYFTSGSFLNPVGTAQQQAEKYPAAAAGAAEAERLTKEIYNLERRRKEQAVELSKLTEDIADQMLIAKDTTRDVADREEAIYKIELMLSQKRAMSVGLEERLATLYKERSSLATDDVAAADATLAQQARAHDMARAVTMEETALLRVKNSIGNTINANTDALKKQREEMQKMTDLQARGATYADALSGGLAPLATPNTVTAQAARLALDPKDASYFKQFREDLRAQIGDITVGVHLEANKDNIVDISNEITSLLESGVARSAELIGSLVGTLAGGGDAWGDFKNAALSSFGDMAIAIGKIAIAAGVGVEGIQAALRFDNPYVAIAAGAALIALGSAIKSSLSSVANGDFSASGGGYSASSASSYGSSDYESREVTVRVYGTLEADGDKLKAVIGETDKKDYYLGG